MGARIKELKNYLDNLQKVVFRNYYGNWMKLWFRLTLWCRNYFFLF
jgi:hypothetical protein